MASAFTYIRRVYLPKFSKDAVSYSTYSRRDEYWNQIRMWASFAVFIAFLSFHIWTILHCRENYRASVCYTLFFSWGAYAVAIGLAGFFAILLHYAYVEDPLKTEFESTSDSSSDDDTQIKSEADSSIVHADEFN